MRGDVQGGAPTAGEPAFHSNISKKLGDYLFFKRDLVADPWTVFRGPARVSPGWRVRGGRVR